MPRDFTSKPQRAGFGLIMSLMTIGCGGGKPMPCTTSGGVNGADGGMRDAGRAQGHAGSSVSNPGFVTIKGDAVACPTITMTVVAPPFFNRDSPSPISGSASNDTGDEVALRWSASAGRFEDRAKAQTMFTCTEPGEQTLTLLAVTRDACSQAVAVAFSCL
jgi:hypothetical protein